jgi:uncharacterized protein (TIGR02391 family)
MSLYDQIMNDLGTSKPLSEVLPTALIYAKQTKKKSLEKWITLEMNGYYSSTKALTKTTVLPEYRAVPVMYYDDYNREVILRGNVPKEIRQYRLRTGIAELEQATKAKETLYFKDDSWNKIVSEAIGVQVASCYFTPAAVIGILGSIKANLIDLLVKATPKGKAAAAKAVPALDTEEAFWQYLHPKVKSLAKTRFDNEFYADAVLMCLKDANSILKKYVKSKNGRELDGAALMTQAFSAQNPIIAFADINTENGRNIQQGYMKIFEGMIIGIRNPKSHENMPLDKNKAIHMLFFCSFLYVKLEESGL